MPREWKRSVVCNSLEVSDMFFSSFFTSWTVTGEKCTRAHVQENKSIFIYISIWKPFWKRVYIHPFSKRFSYRDIYKYTFVFLHMRPCAFFTRYCPTCEKTRKEHVADFKRIADNRAFSLTWQASMQIYWDKRKRLHKKRVQLPKDFLGTPTWPPFRCFRTPIWPPWRHVKTLYIRAFLFFSEKLELRIWRRQNSSFNRVFSQVRQSQVKNAHRRTYKKRKIYIYLIPLYMKTFLKMGVYIYTYIIISNYWPFCILTVNSY